MVYIDMNMVRAGVVKYPGEWEYCGYYEMQSKRQRYNLIDYPKVLQLLNLRQVDELRQRSRERIEEALATDASVWEEKWTRSVAVGSEEFVVEIQEKLGMRGKSRNVHEAAGEYELRAGI